MTQVVAALIRRGEGFMIFQRPETKTRAFQWEFVGGKVEPGESYEEALIRECREELNVGIEVGDIFMNLVHEYPDLTVNLILFEASIVCGEPEMLEHNDIKWLSPGEIPQYEFCPADKDILAEIRRRYM